MPPTAAPPLQSRQVDAGDGRLVLNRSAVCRQLPVFLTCHQAGTDRRADPMSTMISMPLTSSIGDASSMDATSRSSPTFVSHANALFWTPPSAKQLSQRRFTPGGVDAAWADAA